MADLPPIERIVEVLRNCAQDTEDPCVMCPLESQCGDVAACIRLLMNTAADSLENEQEQVRELQEEMDQMKQEGTKNG